MEDCKNSLEFTQPENKIRKKWLFWSILLPAFVFGSITIFTAPVLFVAPSFTTVSGFLLLLLLMAGAVYMNYYCSYKNPGTILLLLLMIGISSDLLTFFFKLSDLALIKMSPIISLLITLPLLFKIIVLYYSYKLRKINKKMKEKRLTASPVYINALSAFSTATNLEELDEQFTKLRSSHDSGGGVKILVKVYNQQKKALTLAKNSLLGDPSTAIQQPLEKQMTDK